MSPAAFALDNDGAPQDKKQGLASLSDVSPLYLLPDDPFGSEVLIPAFKHCSKADCMVGFFASGVFAALAPGLASYIESGHDPLRLIISPLLTPEDRTAIEAGTCSAEEVAQELLQDVLFTEDQIERHTLRCLTWLLRTGRLELRIGLMKDALFHLKVWLFEDGSDVIAAHGSSNVTKAGIFKNVEQVAISKSWEDANQRYVTEKFRRQFDRLWENKADSCLTVPIPDAIKQGLLRTYASERQPEERELEALYKLAETNLREPLVREPSVDPTEFRIPSYLNYSEGPFAHQGKAVEAWVNAGFKGVLEMATGSGKTITAMIGAFRLQQLHAPLLIVVSAPYLPLIDQWCNEIAEFGITPHNLAKCSGVHDRTSELQRLKRRLRSNLSRVELIVVSHDTLCSSELKNTIASFPGAKLLIADEVHNLGRPSFINDPPLFFDYRLGLSATPVRQYDEEGTEALLQYFGPVVFSFTLEESVGKCLVEYDYFLHPVTLAESEMEEWYEITNKIKQNAWRADDGKPDEFISKLLRDRRALLETAQGKVPELERLLALEDLPKLKHTLIYTSDKGPEQIEEVNDLLRRKGILFHQLTAEETRNPKETQRIIGSFQAGELQVLTAKRVLDEGVNIPQIQKAFILASTTVERQWVQRRGRLLRTCSAIGKTHSIIHDLVALPPDMEAGLDRDAKAIVRGELKRAQEFARLSRNAGRPGGPIQVISSLVNAAYL